MTPSRSSLFSHFFIRLLFLSSQILWAIGPGNKFLPNEKQPQLVFSLYPNPLDQGPLYIDCPSQSPKEILIYNLMGELVYQRTTQAYSINLDRLETGIYLVQVTQDQKKGIQRLVVQ